jgi:hypothetical protein
MAVAAVLLAHEDALHQPLRVSRSRCGQTVAVARSLPALARSPKEIVSDSIKFGGVTLDCPNAGKLAEFYAEITGGQVTIPGDDWAMMTTPDGRDICFQAAPAYEAPSWPDPASSMQMHLDFDVDDLDSTEARVLAGPVPRSTSFSPTTTAASTPIRSAIRSACPPLKPFRSKPDRERGSFASSMQAVPIPPGSCAPDLAPPGARPYLQRVPVRPRDHSLTAMSTSRVATTTTSKPHITTMAALVPSRPSSFSSAFGSGDWYGLPSSRAAFLNW